MKIIDTLFQAIKSTLENSLSVTMSEGAIKTLMVDHLLRTGHTILEGGASGSKIIVFSIDMLYVTPTQVPKHDISADIRVILPEKCTIELQTRSDIGSQNALSSKNIIDDVWRVEQGHADLFILIADENIYNKMTGIRSPSGRRPKDENFLPNMIQRSIVRRVQTTFGTVRYVIFYKMAE